MISMLNEILFKLVSCSTTKTRKQNKNKNNNYKQAIEMKTKPRTKCLRIFNNCCKVFF